jgi:hypothetical protein
MVATLGKTRNLTPPIINARIQRDIEARIAYYTHHPDQIRARLQELDKEWDVERAIEAEVAGSVLAGFLFGATLSKKWFLLPAFAGAMLLLHAFRGEYPLLPLFRRLGFRTANEIAQERYALKALRGDFDNIDPARAQDQTSLAFEAADPNSASGDFTPVPV